MAGTVRGREAGNWGDAATIVITDDDEDADDDAEDEEGDTDDAGAVFTVVLQLVDATDAVLGSAGTRIIEPGRAAA